MSKFIEVASGKEVKLGDTITVTSTVKFPWNTEKSFDNKWIVDGWCLKYLENNGIVKEVLDEKDYSKMVIDNLCRKTGCDKIKLIKVLKLVEDIDIWASAQIVLREMSSILNKRYAQPISESLSIYTIMPTNGKIYKLKKQNILSYKGFPAFRTIEDAIIAKSVIKGVIKELFNEDL